MRRFLTMIALLLTSAPAARGDDGYDLWLRYRPMPEGPRSAEYRRYFSRLVMPHESPTLRAAYDEISTAVQGLLGSPVVADAGASRGATLVVGTPASLPIITRVVGAGELRAVGPEGFIVRGALIDDNQAIVIAANSDIGVLYGVFRFVAELQLGRPLATMTLVSKPRIQLRMLDHWDNLDGSVERGYAGRSVWEWDKLPREISPRYRDYARANASIGINGSVLTNVNANAKVLTREYLAKAAAIASVLRPYGIRVYLTARFSAPIDLGGLETADPANPRVRAWWRRKANEIFGVIPDFGGFLVKANSEGQPGPQDYGRTHADGANMLADAVAPHGGVVMWRAFVYSNSVPVDRVKQAYEEFVPLDGRFRANVLVQVKNGPLDFQPREPFHPLFGAMPKTPLMMEFQITKEYLGQDTHVVFLGPLFEEVLQADTRRAGAGSSVARVVDGTLHGYRRTGMAGVANVGTDRNWTGSIANQANWFAFGRIAWDPSTSAAAIAEEWVRMTLTSDSVAVVAIREMMLASREAVVNYMTPLGLAHLMATGHHHGPGPWANAGRADWTPSYYHRADSLGLGFDRTVLGSNGVEQYAEPLRTRYADRRTVPDSVLLWFHHVGWNERLSSGRTLWEEIAFRYNAGVDAVRAMQRTWESVKSKIDDERFRAVRDDLSVQEREARWWRDAALQYFQTFSKMAIPPQYERPAHALDYYVRLRCPDRPHRTVCDVIP
ncbi:MAG: alpha-glucuronidase family glycosyl hydrolase [Gemmatimonadaceae bacterium]